MHVIANAFDALDKSPQNRNESCAGVDINNGTCFSNKQLQSFD